MSNKDLIENIADGDASSFEESLKSAMDGKMREFVESKYDEMFEAAEVVAEETDENDDE